MKHKTTGKGPIYGEFDFNHDGPRYVRGYVRGGKVSQPKVEKVMHEFKHGDLHSGSKTGPKVQSRKQAVAIAMSEGREAAKGMARGGVADSMQQKISAHKKPTVSNVTPQSINVKARMNASYAKGDKVHPDAAQDKALIKKAFSQHDKNLHGGQKETIVLRRGGRAK